MASTLIPRRHRSIIARVLAVLALAACVIAVISIVNAFRNEEDSGGGAKPDRKGNHSQQGSKKSKKSKESKVPKEYVVEAGDNLSAISEKFNVSTTRIEKLNPKIDPQTLTTGQTLTLRK